MGIGLEFNHTLPCERFQNSDKLSFAEYVSVIKAIIWKLARVLKQQNNNSNKTKPRGDTWTQVAEIR